MATKTDNSQSAIIIIRLMVGLVFLSEGIQKFMFPQTLGIGRFETIGFPHPQFFALLAGSFEIFCGILVICGFYTRLAAIPLLIVILTAIYSTKIPFFIHKGFWATMHESRTDFCMLMGLIFILIVGGGKLAIDTKLKKHK